MQLPVLRRAWTCLTTLAAFATVAAIAGCATIDEDRETTGANRPPYAYPQPTTIPPRKTAVSATPRVKAKT
jgi:hypothetical protein